jgi:hypothetical protein
MKKGRDFTPTLAHHQRLFKLIQRTMLISSSAKNLLRNVISDIFSSSTQREFIAKRMDRIEGT